MRDVEVPPEESVDPPAFRFGFESHPWDRSGCRTPMPWSPGPGSGFTAGRPWLRFAPDVEVRNVEAQRADRGSVLSTYRRLLALRSATPALQVGSLRLHPAGGDLVAYTREVPGQRILVVLNPGREEAAWVLHDTGADSAWRVLFGTSSTASPGALVAGGAPVALAPDEAIILEAVR